MGQDARERAQLRADATLTKVMARYKLPAIYFGRLFATAGGVIAAMVCPHLTRRLFSKVTAVARPNASRSMKPQ
jgi:hypothetical protein